MKRGQLEGTLGVGIYTKEIDFFKSFTCTDSFVIQNFTKKEIKYCFSKTKPAFHLAKIFAVKMAALAASGEGMSIINIEIDLHKKGSVISFVGATDEFLMDSYNVSLSHTKKAVTAVVVREKNSASDKKKAIFLDRDGILNVDHGYVSKIADFLFPDGIVDLLKYLKTKDYKFIVVTNQGGIEDGKYTQEDVTAFNTHMQKEFLKYGITFEKIYCCPHSKHNTSCNCRKPFPKMWQMAEVEFDIDMSKSWTIGDKVTDCQGGHAAGTKTILLKSRYNEIKPDDSSVDYFVDKLLDIKKIIVL